MSEMTNWFAAHHEAGHATVAKVLGAQIASLSLIPTPHCLPDVIGLSDEDVATICMGGAAGTLIDFGTMRPCETDIMSAKLYTDDHFSALERAIKIIVKNRDTFDETVTNLIREIGEDKKHDPAYVCVDTVKRVMQSGGELLTKEEAFK